MTDLVISGMKAHLYWARYHVHAYKQAGTKVSCTGTCNLVACLLIAVPKYFLAHIVTLFTTRRPQPRKGIQGSLRESERYNMRYETNPQMFVCMCVCVNSIALQKRIVCLPKACLPRVAPDFGRVMQESFVLRISWH